MDKLVRTEDKAPDGTGYNATPLFFRPISEKEFAQSQFHNRTPKLIEFRQMIPKTEMVDGKFVSGGLIQANLFWFVDDTGIAISADYWAGKVRYFAFGCKHSLKVDSGMGLESPKLQANASYPCSKCGSQVKEDWMQLVVEDSGWTSSKSSRPMYGIHDYERTMKFSRQLNSDEQAMVQKFLALVDCPGYSGIAGIHNGEAVYTFSTTYDSSD